MQREGGTTDRALDICQWDHRGNGDRRSRGPIRGLRSEGRLRNLSARRYLITPCGAPDGVDRRPDPSGASPGDGCGTTSERDAGQPGYQRGSRNRDRHTHCCGDNDRCGDSSPTCSAPLGRRDGCASPSFIQRLLVGRKGSKSGTRAGLAHHIGPKSTWRRPDEDSVHGDTNAARIARRRFCRRLSRSPCTGRRGFDQSACRRRACPWPTRPCRSGPFGTRGSGCS